MKSSKLIFGLILLISLLSSCNKNKNQYIIKGVVQDLTFGTHLSDANISLYKVNASSTNLILVESKSLASDGSYQFNVKRDKFQKLVLVVYKDLYFDIEKEIAVSELSIKQDNIYDLQTTAKSWVKIHLFNINPQVGDQLNYTKQNGKTNCDECCASEQQIFYGALDTTFYCINDANSNYSFLYSASGSGTGTKNTNTTAFDTTLLELNY